jgi:hypothetical protein
MALANRNKHNNYQELKVITKCKPQFKNKSYKSHVNNIAYNKLYDCHIIYLIKNLVIY